MSVHTLIYAYPSTEIFLKRLSLYNTCYLKNVVMFEGRKCFSRFVYHLHEYITRATPRTLMSSIVSTRRAYELGNHACSDPKRFVYKPAATRHSSDNDRTGRRQVRNKMIRKRHLDNCGIRFDLTDELNRIL